MSSSYFTKPKAELDPSLFDGTHLKPDVSKLLISEANKALADEGLKYPDAWVHIWLTGSGISYQWGNGDLDIQLGIDYESFLDANPEFHGIDPLSMSKIINRHLKNYLNSRFDGDQDINGSIYHVTFFWNSLVGSDIDYIKPYAAYDVMADQWVVEPPVLPEDPRSLYPYSWDLSVQSDDIASQQLLQSHIELSRMEQAGGPAAASARAMHYAVDQQAASLYNDIHLGRANAFLTGGHGYTDWHNFRWQSAKDTGTIDRLKTIMDCHKEQTAASDIQLYGGPVKSADEALQEALTWRLTR